MKTVELRKKSIEELSNEMIELLKEQFNLRIQRGAGQPPKQHLFKKGRHAIARIKTILREKGSRV